MAAVPELEASTDLLIGQWRNSPRLQAVIDALLGPIRTGALAALEQLQLQRTITDAEGVWLDWIGGRLGLQRPATTDPTQDHRFGFDGNTDARAFDVAPFAGVAANDAVYPLPDVLYRRLIKARAILVLGDGTLATFKRAVACVDEGARVTDGRDMTVSIVTTNQGFLELADEVGALPRTAGVRIIYVDPERFGFEGAGQPFDQAPFRAGS